MTTLDILLEEYLDENQTQLNKIFDEFGRNIMHMMHDLFIARKGPRIRDLVAHGVIDTKTIPPYFVNSLASLAFCLCLKYDVDNDGSQEYISNIKSNVLKQYVDYVNNYEPVFHPKSFQVRLINSVYQKWCELEYIISSNKLSTNILPHMTDWRAIILTNMTSPIFERADSSLSYDLKFEVAMNKDDTKLLVSLSRNTELCLKITTEIITAYKSLKQRVDNRVASKCIRQNFYLLQENMSVFSWFIQVTMLIVQKLVDSTFTEEGFEFLQRSIKTLGSIDTRVVKNQFSAVKEMVYNSIGVEDKLLLSGREKKVVWELLNMVRFLFTH